MKCNGGKFSNLTSIYGRRCQTAQWVSFAETKVYKSSADYSCCNGRPLDMGRKVYDVLNVRYCEQRVLTRFAL